jgi:hypothetical protein
VVIAVISLWFLTVVIAVISLLVSHCGLHGYLPEGGDRGGGGERIEVEERKGKERREDRGGERRGDRGGGGERRGDRDGGGRREVAEEGGERIEVEEERG